jgi:hypothetical protein
VFPPALFVGTLSSGRATLAHAIAAELGVNIHIVDAEELEYSGIGLGRSPSDIVSILTNLEEGDVLLVRNLEQVRRTVARQLEAAIRSYELSITVGEGFKARKMKLAVNPFTLLGSVARDSELDAQLRRAILLVLRFNRYTEEEMIWITQSVASRLGFSFEPETIALIARTSKGSPKEAQHLITRLPKTSEKTLTHGEACELLALHGVQEHTPGSSAPTEDLKQLSPIEFEQLITRLVRDMGFEAETTKASGDGGIDVEAVLKRPILGGRYLFQCKRFAPDNPVGSAALREFYGAVIADRKAVKGVFITTSTFTPQAVQFAEGLAIELIDGEQLRALLADMKQKQS